MRIVVAGVAGFMIELASAIVNIFWQNARSSVGILWGFGRATVGCAFGWDALGPPGAPDPDDGAPQAPIINDTQSPTTRIAIVRYRFNVSFPLQSKNTLACHLPWNLCDSDGRSVAV